MPIPNDQLTNTQTGSIENNDPNVPVKKITPPANTGNDIASRLSVIQSNIETSKPYTKTEPVPVKKAAIVSEPVKTVPAEKLPQQQEQPESQPTLVNDDYVKKIYDYGVSKNLTTDPYDTFKQNWFSNDQSKQRFYDELSNMSTYEKLPFNVGKTYEEFDSNVKYKGVPKYTDEQKRKLSEGVNDLFGSVNNVITSAVDKISELPTALNDFGQNLNEELKAKYNQTERDPRKNPLSPEFDADRVLADKTDVFNQSKFLTQNEDTDYLKKIGAINQYTEEGTKEELYQLNAEREGLLQSKKQLEELPAFNAQERLTEINSKLDGLDKKIKDKQDILDGVVKQQGVLSNIDKLNQDAFEDISSSWNAPDYDTKRDAYVKKYGEQDVVQAEQELLQRDSDNKLAREIENNPDAILDYKNWNRYKRYIDERFQKRLDKERESFINKNMNELLSQSESEKKALETKAYSDIEDYTNKAALRTQQQVDAIINSNQEFKTLREDYLARMRNAATQEEKNQINQEYKNVINNIPEIKKINDAFKADVEKKSSEIIGQANDKFNKTFNDKITSAIKTHEEKNMVNWLSKAYAPVVNKKEVLQPYVQSVKDEMSKMNLTEGQRKAFLKAEWSRYMRSKIASDPEVSKKVMNNVNLKTAEREFYTQFADQLYDSRRQPSAYALKSMIEDKLAEVEDQIKMVKKRVSSTSEKGAEQNLISVGRGGEAITKTTGQLESSTRLANLEETKRRLEQAADHPETDGGYWSDFWRGLSSKEGIEYIPVVGSLYNISHDLTVKDVADKMAEGKPLQWHEKGLLESLAMQKEFTKLRPTSTAYSVGQGIGEMVPIIGEFMLTAGLGTAAKSTTTKILKNQIQKSITKNIESQIAKGIVTKEAGDAMLKEGIKQIGESGTSKYLIKGLSLFVQANAQTAANPQQYIEKTIERMTPQVSMMMTDQGDKLELQIDSRGEDFGEAFLKAYGSTATEFLTEAAGGSMLFKAGGKVSKEVMNPEWFKRTLLGSWMSKRGINSVDNAYKIILKEKLGWNGVLSELGEEIDAHALEGLITGDHSMIMTPDELLNTALTVGVMGAAFKTPSVLRPIGKFIKDNVSNTVIAIEGLKDKDGKNKSIKVNTAKWNQFTKLQDRPYASDFAVTRAIEKLGLPEEESALLKQFHYQSMAKKNESLEKAETLKKPTVPAPEKRENAFGYEDFTENPNYSDANQAKHTPSDIIALNSALESGKKDEKIVNQESLHNAEKWALNTRDLVAKNESLSEEEKKNTLDYLGGIIANIRTEHELQNEKQNDKEDQKWVSGEVGIGQELVETKPIEEGSAKTTEPGGMVQTPQEEVATKQEPVATSQDSDVIIKNEPNTVQDGDDLILMHGTPHDFTKFELEKIGTGEGAQAFGYGLYFTDGSKIAEQYAKKLSDDKTGIVYQVRIKNGFKKEWVEWREQLDQDVEDKLYNSLSEEERNQYENYLEKSNFDNGYAGTFDQLRRDKDGLEIYDKQSSVGLIYRDLRDAFGQEKATEIFKRAGVDGIKYRSNKGFGNNFNYVVFDPNSIEIIKKDKPSTRVNTPIATAQEKPSSRKENTDRVKKKKQQEVKQETEDLLDAVAVASEPVYETQDKTVSSPSVKREANVVYNELREATEERIKIERKIKSRDSWKGQELRAEKQQLTRRLNKINKRIFELNSEYSDITGKNIGDITEDVYLDIVNTTEQKPTVKEEVKPVKTETKKDIVAERIKALETGKNVESVFKDIGDPIEEEAAVIREKLGISDSKAVTSQQLYDAYSKKKGKKEWDRFYNVLRNEIGQVWYKKRKAEEKAKQEEEKRKKEAQEAQAMKTTKASAEGRVSESEAAHKGSKKKTAPKEDKVDFDYKEIYDFEKDAIEAGIKKNSRFWNNIVRALKIISNPANHKSVTQQPYDSAEDAIKALMKTVKDEVESKLTVATKQTGTAFRRIENKIKELSKQKPEAKTEIKKEVKSEPVVEEYVPITQKDIEIGKFRKDEALDYYTDEKELDSGRMSEYISSMTVDVTNMEGESIGNLVRNTDEDKNNTWEALDSDGNNITIGRGKNSVDEFDTKQEAIDAILNAYNKKKKKEFDAEQKRINKKKEKEAQKEKNKVKEIEEDPALKSVEKSRKEKKSKIIEKAEKELEQQTEEFSAKKLDVESIGAAAKMPAVTLVINKLKDARKNIKNFKNHKELAEYSKINDELFGSYVLRLFQSNIINRDQMNQLNRLYSEIQRDITLLSDKKSSIDELYANPILRSQGGKTNTGVVFMQSKEERLAPEYLEPSAEVKTKKTEQIINQFYNRLVKSFDKLKSKDKRFSYFKKMAIKKALDRVKVTNAVAKKKNAPVGFFDTLFKHIVLVSTGRNDLDTFVHEIGHNVDVELGFLESLENNPAAIEEVKNLSRFSPTKTEDGTTNQLREGLAEFIRAIAIAPNSTAQLYPELTKAYQELVPSEIQGAVSEIGDHYRMVASMDTFDRGMQTMLMAEDIKREKQIKVKELGTVFRYRLPVAFMQKFVDRLYTTNAIIRILRAYDPNKEFKGLSDPELLMRLYAGVGVKAESWLHDGLRDKNFKVKTDEITGEAISLRWVMDLFDKMNSKKQKKDKEFVSLYMNAQRFIELRNRDIEEHKEEVDSYVNSMNEAVAKLDEKIDEKETYILLLQNKLDDIKSSNSKAGKSDLEYKIKKSKEKLNSLKQQKKTAQQNIQEAEASKETYKPSDDYINLSSGVGMDNYQSAVDIINKVELMKDTNPERYKLATETARRYRVYAENLLEYLVETDKLSKSDFKTIKSKNQYYVALNRIETDSEGLVVKPKPTKVNTENLSSQKFQIKKVQGSEKTVVDPFLSLCVNTHKIAAEGDRNSILTSLTDIINHVANNNGSFAEMMGGYLVGKEEIDPKTGLKVQPEIKTDGTTVVYRNGLKEYWKFNEDFDTAIKGILNTSSRIPIISWVTKVLKSLWTLSPSFIINNFQRDTLERFMISPTGSPLKGFKPGKKFSQERDLFRATGGSQSYLYSMGENTEEFLLDIQKELRNINFIDAVSTSPKKIKSLLAKVENANRVAEFRHARKVYEQEMIKKLRKENEMAVSVGAEPKTDQQIIEEAQANAIVMAAADARGLMDFYVAGEWMRFINQVVPFANASIRGSARYIEGLHKAIKFNDPKYSSVFLLRNIIYGSMAEIFVKSIEDYFIGDDEDKLEEILERRKYEKDMFYQIPTPLGNISIAKPHSASLFANYAGEIYDYYVRGDKYAFTGTGEKLSRFTGFFDNFENSNIPVAMARWVGLVNTDSFGGYIIDPDELYVPVSQRSPHRKQVLSGAIEDTFGVDARRIDAFISEFGYYGKLVNQAINSIAGEKDGFDITSTGLFRKQKPGATESSVRLKEPKYTFGLKGKSEDSKRDDDYVTPALGRLKRELYGEGKTEEEKADLAKTLRTVNRKIRIELDRRAEEYGGDEYMNTSVLFEQGKKKEAKESIDNMKKIVDYINKKID